MVVNRYVKSLYDVSIESNQESVFLKQIELLQKFLKDIPETDKFLKGHELLTYKGNAFIQNLIKELSLSVEIGNFLKLILKNKRFSLLPEICEKYLYYVGKRHGKKTFYVTYSKEFTSEDEKILVQNLGKVFKCDIKLVTRKDERLIDGLQIRHRSKVLDYSMKSKLLRLGNAMKGDDNEH